MDRTHIPRLAACWLLLPALAAAAPALAQTSRPEDAEKPRVEKLSFEGVDALSKAVLADSIVTQATRCRVLILKPLCWISDSKHFVDKHYLDRAELARDELRIRVIYFRRGYRQVRVSSDVAPEGDGVAVTFRVEEGEPTVVSSLTVGQTDSVLTHGQLRRAGLPPEGAPLDLIRLDSGRIRLRAMLWDQGYADAVVRDTARIDGGTRSAALEVEIEARRRATIDDIVVRGNEKVSAHTIRRVLGFRPGQLYRRTDMTAAQRRLYETELFRQSLVHVPEEADSAKTVQVTVREAPFRGVRAGVGFNTTEFVQTEARLTRYNWRGGARRLDARAAVGNLLAPQFYGKSIFGSAVPEGIEGEVEGAYLDPTWQVGLNMNQPFFISSLNSLELSVSAHRRSIPGIVIDRGVSASATVTRRLANGVPLSLAYRFEQTRVEAGDVYFCINFGVCDPPVITALAGAHRLSPLRLAGHIERTDDPLAPTNGFSARLEAEHASALTVSDFRYHRIAVEAARYLRRGRSVWAGRVRAGWVRPLASTAAAVGVADGDLGILHPRRRFYAGGARSVRGYAENQLGPRVLTIPPERLLFASDSPGAALCLPSALADGSCDPNLAPSEDFQPRPLGGNSLIEGSIEYRTPLSPNITGALFVDAGLVRGQRLNFPPGTRSAVTPGFGIRYRSPIGPVRLDLGIRPGLAEELPVVTEIVTPDGQVRLVQLRTLKRYDPLEESGSFLGGFFSRLQLHLAIGEAF